MPSAKISVALCLRLAVSISRGRCAAVASSTRESGVDELEKQRPLKLQEALKKITIGIHKNRMAKLWHKLGVCDESQYAFLLEGDQLYSQL